MKKNLWQKLFVGIIPILASCSNSFAADTIEVGHSCSYFGEKMPENATMFGSINEAEEVIQKIVDAFGIAKRFNTQAASVPNAAAVIQGSTRFILYNPKFMSDMKRQTGNHWAPISIMAHEIAHHLNGHTLVPGGSRPPTELEADFSSGSVLEKLGASLEDSLAAMNHFGSSSGSATHPSKNERLAAITSGWIKSCELAGRKNCGDGASANSQSSEKPTTPPPVDPNPQIRITDSCVINGENVLVTSQNAVISPMRGNTVVGQRVPPPAQNCVFGLSSQKGIYCVSRGSGQVFARGVPVPVGQCQRR